MIFVACSLIVRCSAICTITARSSHRKQNLNIVIQPNNNLIIANEQFLRFIFRFHLETRRKSFFHLADLKSHRL